MTFSSIPLFRAFSPPEVLSSLKPVFESGQLACGPRTAEFERGLAEWLGATGCAALNDASGALMMALYLADVRPGDEVIASPMACAATLMPIANLFARPVWCDIDPWTGMIDSRQIASLVSENTKAVLLYHWSGNVAAIDDVSAVAKQHHLKLVQDASEAFGAEYRGRRLGGEADFTVYSFYATKHVNCGEGAALLADPGNLKAARRLRRFGIDYSLLRLANGDLNQEFDIPLAGYNLAMNEIPASLGIAALSHADEIVKRHRDNGAFFESALAGISGLRQLRQQQGSTSGYWTYSFLAERRDDLIRKLASHGIAAQRLHLRNDRYTCFGGAPKDLPGVSAFDAANLSVPCGWWIGSDERERIADCIRTGW